MEALETYKELKLMLKRPTSAHTRARHYELGAGHITLEQRRVRL